MTMEEKEKQENHKVNEANYMKYYFTNFIGVIHTQHEFEAKFLSI